MHEIAFTALQTEGANSPLPAPAESSCPRCDAQQSAASAARSRCAELESCALSLSEQNRRLKGDNDKLHEDNKTLEATNASLNANAAAASNGLDRERQLKEENETLLTQLRSLETQLAASSRRVEELAENKRSLEAAADVFRQQTLESEQRQGEINELQGKIASLNSGLSEMEEEKKHLQERQQDLSASLQTSEKTIDERDRRIKSLEDERDHVKSTLQENDDKFERLYAQQASDLRSKDQDLLSIHANAAERDAQLRRDHEASEAAIANLRQEVEHLQKRLSEQLGQHDLDKERAHEQTQGMLSKQKADHEQEHLQIISKQRAEHERDKERVHEHFQGILSKQKADHEQEHLQILSKQRAEHERNKEMVLEQIQQILSKERAEHEETRSKHERLRIAYKEQQQHYGLGRAIARPPARKEFFLRELRPDKEDDLYILFDAQGIEVALNTYDFKDDELCVGRTMQRVLSSSRNPKSLLESWRIHKILTRVPKKDFDQIRTRPRFVDFSGLEQLGNRSEWKPV